MMTRPKTQDRRRNERQRMGSSQVKIKIPQLMLRESHKRLEALKGKDPSALLLSGGEITISPEATTSEKASSAANFKSYMNVTTGQGKVYTKYASQSPQALGNAHGKLATMQSSPTTK